MIKPWETEVKCSECKKKVLVEHEDMDQGNEYLTMEYYSCTCGNTKQLTYN